jgi:hypothetical protein
MHQLKEKIHHIWDVYNWPIVTLITLADYALTFFIVSIILFFVHFGHAFPFRQAVLAALVLTILQIGAFAYACFLVDLDQRKKEKEERKKR